MHTDGKGHRLTQDGSGEHPPLRTLEKTGYALGDFASCLIWQAISVYLLYYFTNVAGVETGPAVAIISASKIIDGVTDILMGFIIERTRTRFGKVRPYLLTMGLPLGISTVLLFSIPAGLGTDGKLIWIFVSYNLVTSVFYTALNVPYSGMHCFLTDDSMERSRLSILRLVFAYAAQVLVNAVFFSLVRGLGGGELSDRGGWTGAAAVIGTAAFGIALVTFFTTHERVSGDAAGQEKQPSPLTSLRSVLRNRYILLLFGTTLCSFTGTALFSGSAAYYAQFVLHNVDATGMITNAATIAQVLGLIFVVPALLKRYSKHLIYLAGTGLMASCFLLSRLFSESLPALLALNALKGLAMGATTSMVYAMCADAVDYGEYKTGVRAAGLGTAFLQCMGKFGIGLGTALMGAVLTGGGFDAEAAEQTGAALNALKAVYTYIPGIILGLSLAIMLAYRLDAIYPEVADTLLKRREEARKAKQ